MLADLVYHIPEFLSQVSKHRHSAAGAKVEDYMPADASEVG